MSLDINLVRYAKQVRYERAEGLDEGALDFTEELNEAIEKLPPEGRDYIYRKISELSEAAGVTEAEASSALLGWLVMREAERLDL